MNWHPIAMCLPADNVLVLVCGPSGCTIHTRFTMTAYKIEGYHQGTWIDAQGERLDESGQIPTHRSHIPEEMWPA